MKKTVSVLIVSAAIFAILWVIRLFSLVSDVLLLALLGAALFLFGAVVLKVLVPRVRVNRFFVLRPMNFLQWELTVSAVILLICGSFLLNYVTSAFYELLAVDAPRAFSGTEYSSVGVALLCVAVLPSLFEELFFRGAVLSMLRSAKWKNATAILLSALLFMLLHGPSWYFLSDLYAGVILACLVYFTDSLYSAIVAHLLTNGLSYFLALYGGRLEDAGIENLPLHLAVVCFLGAMCHILHLIKKLILRRDAEDRSRVNENSRRWDEQKKEKEQQEQRKGAKHHGDKSKKKIQ